MRVAADEMTFATLLLCAMTFLAFFTMYAMEDAEADAPETGVTDAEYMTDNDEISVFSSWYGHVPPLMQMNGTLWMFDMVITTYGSEHEVWGYFSTDKGHTFSGIKIMDEEDPGFETGGYPWMIIDGVVLSNNSIVLLVLLWDYDTTDGRELHLLCHWNNTDLSQWEQVTIYSSITYDVEYNIPPSMAIDSNDLIMIAYARGSTLYYGTWDMTDRLQDDSWTKTSYLHRDFFGPWVMCNTTDVFLLGNVWASAVDYIKVYTMDGTWTELWSQGTSSNYRFYDCVVTADDTFIAISSMTAAGYNRFYYYNETSSGSRSYIAAGNTDGKGPKICLTGASPSWFTLIQYHSTADRYKTHSNYYYRDPSIWKTVDTDRWQETEDTTKDWPWMGSRDLYPRFWDDDESEWIYTQLPDTGWIFSIGDYDTGADDIDHHLIHLSSTTWPAIPWYMGPPPNIATITLDDGTYGTWYSFTLTGEYGETPYIWSLLVGPAWLNIGASNGTIYGDPGGVGSFTVTVRLTETHDAPRSDDETWTLKINSASSDGGDEPVSANFIYDDIGEMWMLLALTATFVALARTWKMATYRREQR